MNYEDNQKRSERALNELREAYQYYLAGYDKGLIYNLLYPSTQSMDEEFDLTMAKSILGKFTLSGKVA